jgi:hypothetical protein
MVEARHEISHGRPTLQACLARCLDKHATPRHRQQRGCATHVIDAFARAADDTLQGRTFRTTQPTQWLALWRGHSVSLFPQYPANTPAPAIWGMTH